LQTKQRGWTNERIIACFSGWWHGKRVALFGFSTASALTRGFSAANFVRQYRANEGLQLLRSGDILIYAVYVLVSVLGGIVACWVGWKIAL